MRHPTRGEMMPDSPALHAQKLRVPIKLVRSLHLLDGISEIPQEHCHNLVGPEVTEAMQKSSVYHKLNPDEPRFPCIGSRVIPHSPSNMTSGLTSFR